MYIIIYNIENAIGCGSYINQEDDIEMWQIADFLESIKDCKDVREHCKYWKYWCKHHPSIIK